MQKKTGWVRNTTVALALVAFVASAHADYTTLLKQAKAGDQKSQLELGRVLMYGYDGAPQDPREAVRWLTSAKNGGGEFGRRATVNLGILHSKKSLGQANGAKAVKLLEEVARDAEMTGKMARYNLAVMNHASRDEATIPPNYDKALFWYFAAQASAAPEYPGSGVDAQIDRSIRRLMTESTESAVEIRGQAVEWVRRVEGRR